MESDQFDQILVEQRRRPHYARHHHLTIISWFKTTSCLIAIPIMDCTTQHIFSHFSTMSPELNHQPKRILEPLPTNVVGYGVTTWLVTSWTWVSHTIRVPQYKVSWFRASRETIDKCNGRSRSLMSRSEHFVAIGWARMSLGPNLLGVLLAQVLRVRTANSPATHKVPEVLIPCPFWMDTLSGHLRKGPSTWWLFTPLSPYQSAQNPVSTSYMMLYVFLGLVSPIEQARDIYQLP